MRSHLGAVLLCGGGLLFSACSGTAADTNAAVPIGSDDEQPTTSATATTETTTRDVAAPSDDQGASAPVDPAGAEAASSETASSETASADQAQADTPASPINAALGIEVVPYDVDAEPERLREFALAIQACMHARGFEYTQDILSPVSVEPEPEVNSIDPALSWRTAEYSARYGYGIVVTALDQFANYAPTPRLPPESAEQTYLNTLSEAGRDAYMRALYGDQESLEAGLSNRDARKALIASGSAGCVLAVAEDQRTPEEKKFEALQDQFSDFFLDLQARIETDSRLLTAGEEWQRCMSAQGYSYTTRDEPLAAVQASMSTLEEAMYGTYGPADGVVLDDATVRALDDAAFNEYRQGFVFLDPKITPELQDEIDELAAFEIGVATADVLCAETADLAATEDAVRRELEQRFVDQNEGAIIAILEALNDS